MLWKIKDNMGKGLCIFFAIILLLASVCLFCSSLISINKETVSLLLVSSIGIMIGGTLLAAAFEKKPEETKPPSQKINMFLMIQRVLGRKRCVFFMWFYLIAAILLLFVTFSFAIIRSTTVFILFMGIWMLFFVGFGVMLRTYWEEDPEESLNNSTETLGTEINVPTQTADPAIQEEKPEDNINYWIEHKIIQYEMELEDAGKEVTPRRRLQFLKELFCDGDMDLEEYKKQKRRVISIYLDDFFSEIDMRMPIAER